MAPYYTKALSENCVYKCKLITYGFAESEKKVVSETTESRTSE
jgi:hypothetical protein